MGSAETAIVSSLVTGLLVVVGSALSAWLSGKATVAAADKRVRAEFLGSRRQVWLDTLREDLAEFMARANSLQARTDSEDLELRRLAQLRHKLDLMLSEHEPNHMELSEALKRVVSAAISQNNKAYTSHLDEALHLARSVLKAAWEEAKTDIS